jgi:lysozyme
VKTSPTGLAFVAQWEGTVLRTYKDVAGVPTIGVGHALRPGEEFPDGITHDQALALLASDIRIAEAAVNANVTRPIGQNAFDALVSFAFNCGGGALYGSSILRFLNAGAPEQAADGFLLWCKRADPATGQLVQDGGLLARRRAERALFLAPDSPNERPTAPELPPVDHTSERDDEAQAVADEPPDPPAAA